MQYEYNKYKIWSFSKRYILDKGCCLIIRVALNSEKYGASNYGISI